MNTQIYVMTHKKIADIPNEIYTPLHVGKEGKESLGYIGDDTGDQISDKNDSYCELTGMYWLWKNLDCDIIGICHYRRYFTKEEQLLDKSYIEQTIRSYPIIIPNSSCANNQTVLEQYKNMHHSAKDLYICRDILAEKYPEYLAAFDYCMQTILISAGNMWITKKSIYDRYCRWLFSILFEAEKRIDTTAYDDYQKRVMGFLSERLFRVWLLMQPEKITEENVKLIDPSDFHNAQRKTELYFQCARLKILPVLQLYLSGSINGSLAQPLECTDDFIRKIPVWVCWWQGVSDMPDLIRFCISSLKQNLPQEKTTLRLITLENCMEYVTFTETIIRKFNEGKITLTHLSDILRAELLYRYGGMWIDATYFVSSPVPDQIFEQTTIYTLKFDMPIWSSDITQGRWSGNLWCTRKGHRLFQFLMECFWYYWEMEDELIDYYLIDDIIAVAVENLPDIKNELDLCACSSKKVFQLHESLNQKYTKERAGQLTKDSVFYKLNRHTDYHKENIAGEQTMYGYLYHQYETTCHNANTVMKETL